MSSSKKSFKKGRPKSAEANLFKKLKQVGAVVLAGLLIFSIFTPTLNASAQGSHGVIREQPQFSLSEDEERIQRTLDRDTGERDVLLDRNGEEIHLDEIQLDVLNELSFEQLNRGVIGFYEEYALPNDDTPTSIIVMFEHSPADVQVLEAFVYGERLSYADADAIVENDHETFRRELADLFSNSRVRSASYQIHWEYRIALNGVNLTVPANLVNEIANFDSVRAVYPNGTVTIDPIVEGARNPQGMAPGRNSMNADALHAMGYTGAGVLVAVLDTGIDYYHPAFNGVFPTLAEAQLRNPDLTEADTIGGYFKGRNFVDDLRFFPELEGMIPADNDPMESTYEMFLHGGFADWNLPARAVMTSHGTHVAGTIVGQDTGGDHSILGVAPGAQVIAYRVLGLGGSGDWAGIIAGVEHTVIDGADVVNMSLGGSNNTPAGLPLTTSVNNVLFTNPDMVFVIAAGNDGPNFATMGSPAVATRAISVSNIAEAGYTGARVESGTTSFDITFAATPASWFSVNPDTGWVEIESDYLAQKADGSFQIFALPRTNNTNGTVGTAPGVGVAADFTALISRYGEEALEGAFLLVRRGYDFINVTNRAMALGMGGVIAINNDDEHPGSLIQMPIPYLFVGLTEGLAFYETLSSPATITFAELIHTSFSLNPSSSRGPVFESYEIKPDLGANGTDVLSAVPAWYMGVDGEVGGGGGDDYTIAYAEFSGTSMAAPHVAGAVALMMEYSRDNGDQFCAEEIKVRLMNTSTPFDVGVYSVFDKGTGYVDVLAAIQADVFVYVTYDRVASVFGAEFWDQDFQSTRTGSFSFGGNNFYFNERINDGIDRTLEATIANESNQSRTFELAYSFNVGPRGQTRDIRQNGGDFVLSHSTVTVAANSTSNFTATLTLPTDAPLGFYEGHVYVTENGTLVARLPFAGVMVEAPVAYSISDVFLQRPVMTTNFGDSDVQWGGTDNVQWGGSFLTLFYTPHAGFRLQTRIFRNVDGINASNWNQPQFADAFVGYGLTMSAWEDGFAALGEQYRGLVFDGLYLPPGTGSVVTEDDLELLEEGDFILVMQVHQQTHPQGGWMWEEDILLPFAVDNTPPEITVNNLGYYYCEVAGEEVFGQYIDGDEPIIITGNVFDLWTYEAEQAGVTFDVWLEDGEVGQHMNHVWLLINNMISVQAEVDADGNFSIDAGNINTALPLEVTLVAIDNVAPIFSFDAYIGGQGIFDWPGDNHLVPPGVVWIHEGTIESYLESGHVWGFLPHNAFDWRSWGGLNMIETSFTLIGGLPRDDDFTDRQAVSVVFNETHFDFRELDLTGDVFNPIESFKVDFGVIMHEYGVTSLPYDLMLHFGWFFADDHVNGWGPMISLRQIGFNPFDPSTHIWEFDMSHMVGMAYESLNHLHPIYEFGQRASSEPWYMWHDGFTFDFDAVRWLAGDWQVIVDFFYPDADIFFTYKSEVITIDIEELPTGGVDFVNVNMPEHVHMSPGDLLEIEIVVNPLVDYDDIAIVFMHEPVPKTLLDIPVRGTVMTWLMMSHVLPLEFFDDHTFRANFIFGDGPFDLMFSGNGHYRLYVLTSVDGEWQYVDYSTTLTLTSYRIGEALRWFLMYLDQYLLLPEDFTEEVFLAFQNALEQARTWLSNYDNGIENELHIDFVYEYLDYRWHALLDDLNRPGGPGLPPPITPVERLRNLVNEIVASDYVEEDFTAESWIPFAEALYIAQRFLAFYDGDDNPGFTPFIPALPGPGDPGDDDWGTLNPDELYYNLREAHAGLELGDYPLQKLIDLVDDILATGYVAEEFTLASWITFIEALEFAQEFIEYHEEDDFVLLDDDDRFTLSVREVYYSLRESREGLVRTEALEEARQALQDLIDYAESLNEADFTPETWSELQAALVIARGLLDSDDLVAINNAIANLQDAIDNLKYIEDDDCPNCDCDEECPNCDCDEECPNCDCDEECPNCDCDEECPNCDCDEECPNCDCDEECPNCDCDEECPNYDCDDEEEPAAPTSPSRPQRPGLPQTGTRVTNTLFIGSVLAMLSVIAVFIKLAYKDRPKRRANEK